VAIGSRNKRLLAVIQVMHDNLENPLGIDELVEQVGISRRQAERLFKRYLGISPSKYATQLRLDRGRSLLAETDMSITEIAIACGFGSTGNFSARFRQRFGVSPAFYLKSWNG